MKIAKYANNNGLSSAVKMLNCAMYNWYEHTSFGEEVNMIAIANIAQEKLKEKEKANRIEEKHK